MHQSDSLPTEQYVYASYIDEPIIKDGTGGLSYYHRGQQYSITALTNAAGTITERYAYDAYGNLEILDATASTIATSTVNNSYTYYRTEIRLYRTEIRFRNRRLLLPSKVLRLKTRQVLLQRADRVLVAQVWAK